MKYRATRTFGKFRAGEVYEITRLRLEERSAIRSGLLVAASGWCAPSEAVFSIPCPSFLDAEDGLLELPKIQTVRGGVRFPDTEQPAKKARKPRKKADAPLTLEDLRG